MRDGRLLPTDRPAIFAVLDRRAKQVRASSWHVRLRSLKDEFAAPDAARELDAQRKPLAG